MNILAIGAHLDDCEMGCGGLIALYAELGHRVVILNTVGNCVSLPYIGKAEKNELFKESAIEAAKVLGAEKMILDYEPNNVPVDFSIKKRIAQIVYEVKPDIALIPEPRACSPLALWPDHENTTQVSIEALIWLQRFLRMKTKSVAEIYKYESGANMLFTPEIFIDISEVMHKIVESYRCFYNVPGKEWSDYAIREKRIVSEYRGLQCKTNHEAKYAEAYTSLVPIPRSCLSPF